MSPKNMSQKQRITLEGEGIKRLYGTSPVTLEQVFDGEFTVPESSAGVDTGIDVRPLDRLVFRAGGTIWAGVVFTGENGPQGWNYTDNNPKFPLPGGHPYSLLARLAGRYFEVGAALERVYTGPREERLFLEINDDAHGNGSGAFTCNVEVFRRVS